jgi:hypothetical protein
LLDVDQENDNPTKRKLLDVDQEKSDNPTKRKLLDVDQENDKSIPKRLPNSTRENVLFNLQENCRSNGDECSYSYEYL